MATIKIDLYKGKTLADGRHPIVIKVTHGAVRRKTIAAAFASEWDDKKKRIKRSRKDYAKINLDIENAFSKYEARFKELKQSGRLWNPGDVFCDYKHIAEPQYTFFEIGEIYIEAIRHKNIATYMTWRSNLSKFRTYAKDVSLTLKDIDRKLLEGYIKHLQNLDNSNLTICNSIRTLRIVSNYAHKNKLGNRSEDLHSFQLPKIPKSVKRKLTVQEFLSFAAVSLPMGSFTREAQQTFLLAVYLRGMRIADIIQLEQSFFIDGRVRSGSHETVVVKFHLP